MALVGSVVVSLVNDMLNDLEQRRAAQPAQQENLSWLTGSQGSSASRSKTPFRAIIVVVIVGLLTLAVYQWFLSQQQESQKPQAVVPVQQTAAITSVEQPVVHAKLETPSKSQSLPKPDEQPMKNAAPVVYGDSLQEKIRQEKAMPIVDKTSIKLQAPPIVAQEVAKNVSAKEKPVVKKVAALTLEQRDQQQFERAKKRIQQGEVQQAINQLSVFLQAFPKAEHSGILLIETLLAQNNLLEAQRLLQQRRQQFVSSPELRRLQGHWLLLNEQPEKTVNLLIADQPAVKQHIAYYELLALAAQRSAQYALSIDVYKALLQHNDQHAPWWLGLAISEDLSMQQADARHHFKRSIDEGGLGPALREYAELRFRALAGAVNKATDQ